MLLLIVSVPMFQMPPPATPAMLSEMVLLLTVRVPRLLMAPPCVPVLTELPENVQLLTVRAAPRKLWMPAPSWARLLEKLVLLTVSVPQFRMAQKVASVSVRPEMLTVDPMTTSKIGCRGMPAYRTVKLAPPGPWMSMFVFRLKKFARLIVPVTSKVMVSSPG